MKKFVTGGIIAAACLLAAMGGFFVYRHLQDDAPATGPAATDFSVLGIDFSEFTQSKAFIQEHGTLPNNEVVTEQYTEYTNNKGERILYDNQNRFRRYLHLGDGTASSSEPLSTEALLAKATNVMESFVIGHEQFVYQEKEQTVSDDGECFTFIRTVSDYAQDICMIDMKTDGTVVIAGVDYCDMSADYSGEALDAACEAYASSRVSEQFNRKPDSSTWNRALLKIDGTVYGIYYVTSLFGEGETDYDSYSIAFSENALGTAGET